MSRERRLARESPRTAVSGDPVDPALSVELKVATDAAWTKGLIWSENHRSGIRVGDLASGLNSSQSASIGMLSGIHYEIHNFWTVDKCS